MSRSPKPRKNDDGTVATLRDAVERHAPALLDLTLRDETLLEGLAADRLGTPRTRRKTLESFRSEAEGLRQGPELMRALRRARHRELLRVALREGLGLGRVEQTCREVSYVAEAATQVALTAALEHACGRWGVPTDTGGRPIPIVVLGMGKLGGEELNLGSDVDLCFFYGTDDGTVGDGKLTVHELFTRVAAATTQALADVTEDGFCFRVDLRLRPEGTSGALVNSLASAERYYEAWGRTWERAALLRSRPIAGDAEFGRELLDALRPFVFRKSIDPKIAVEMAELVRRARREGNVDDVRNVKLGRGGIREAEFFVQTLQLVWGGKHPRVQVPGTLAALRALQSDGFVTHREATTLARDWAFLRTVEHRIHAFLGYQTHELPHDRATLERLASSLQMASGATLVKALDKTRERVAKLFESLETGEEPSHPELERLADLLAARAAHDEVREQVQIALPVADADEASSHLVRLARRADAPLGPLVRQERPRLGAMMLREIAESADPDSALRFLADFLASAGGSSAYERLLGDDARLRRRLIALFGASAMLSSALIGHPEEVDWLLATREPPSETEIAHDHAAGGPEDPEEFIAWLRRAKRVTTLRLGLAYVSGELPLAALTARNSRLAEAQIGAALARASRDVTARLGTPRADATEPLSAELVVCALGKLGGSELGIGGDLDLVFLFGADGTTERGEPNAEVFTRIAQRTMRLLSQPDAEGPGYSTDTRLRPSGSQGMLVVSVGGFDRYHKTHAAPWERQALIRARPVAGSQSVSRAVTESFAHLAYEVGAMPREELCAMRGRIERELGLEVGDRRSPKFGRGGIVDIEFLAQWLQMTHGAEHRAVRTPNTREALEALGAEGILTPTDTRTLCRAYDFLRVIDQALKLVEDHGDAVLHAGGRDTARVARALGIGVALEPVEAASALMDRYASHTDKVRSIFMKHLGDPNTTKL